MGWKLPLSVTISTAISFFAWIAVQLNRPLGLATFGLAFILPVLVFRRYYSRKPRMLVPFGVLAVLIAILLTPPPGNEPEPRLGAPPQNRMLEC